MISRRMLALLTAASASSIALAQTTAGIGTTIVFPVTAQTASFASEVTIYNPGPSALTAHVTFFEANNSSTPGTKVCTDAAVPANRSLQFSIGTQCPLAAGSHFGLLVVSDSANPQSNNFYGYTRVQNPAGIGFSIEGFPIQNFNNQVSHATGLKRQAASPTYQTNCFVGSLEQPVSYELKLFDDTAGTQIGTTLTGSLNAFEQYRYLDVFGSNGVNAPAGDQLNVRAQFTQTSGGSANLIGFCTVQDNMSFGADFRIAKSYGSPSNSFFAQGGNAFGTTAKLGTLDNQPLIIVTNNQPTLRLIPATDADNTNTVNVINGSPLNTAGAVVGATIAGGGGTVTGVDASNHFGGQYSTVGGGAQNTASGNVSTVAGGSSNTASGNSSAVAGGSINTASGLVSTVGGGQSNTASGFQSTVGGGQNNIANAQSSTVGGGYSNAAHGNFSTVPGGYSNQANGTYSFAAGHDARGDQDKCAAFGFWSTSAPFGCLGSTNIVRIGADHGFDVEYFSQRGDGGGNRWVHLGDLIAGATIFTWTGAYLSNAGVWTNNSDVNRKTDFERIDPAQVLASVSALPITRWRYLNEDPGKRHMGPMAQDFWGVFGLGDDDKHIGTVDEAGVALAAIQGLVQIVQEKDARIAELERRLKYLEHAVEALATK